MTSEDELDVDDRLDRLEAKVEQGLALDAEIIRLLRRLVGRSGLSQLRAADRRLRDAALEHVRERVTFYATDIFGPLEPIMRELSLKDVTALGRRLGRISRN